MLANLRDLGRLATWPLGRLAAAMIGGERSSRGLALAMLPHVAALVAPSARVRTRASRGTRQGLSRALRQSQCWAWCPARRCRQRYGSTPQPWRAQAPTARDGCESPEVAKPHLRSASRLWAGWRPLRCRMPGMQATARAHGQSFRRYLDGEHAAALQVERPSYRRKDGPPSYPGLHPETCALFSDEKESPDSRDSFDREPRFPVSRRRSHVPLGKISPRYVV